MTKFGRSATFVATRWQEHVQSSARRDHRGEDGNLRLWLAKKEFGEKRRGTYIDACASESGPQIKKPSNEDRGALRRHVGDFTGNLGFAHEHFAGRATSMFQAPASSVPASMSQVLPVENVGAENDEMDIGAEAADGMAGVQVDAGYVAKC
eukprot:3238262-Amphidinium_carterae.1